MLVKHGVQGYAMERFPDSFDSRAFIAEAESLVLQEDRPIERGKMLVAALQGGMDIEPDRLLETVGLIPNDSETKLNGISPFQEKVSLMRHAAAAYTDKSDFVAAETVAITLKPFNDHAYLDSIFTMLRHGYAG